MKIKLNKLKPFSKYFSVKKEDADRLGFCDIIPAVDTKLYIDAKLLTDDNHPLFLNAKSTLKSKFTLFLECVRNYKSESTDDIYWEACNKFLLFKEISGTCIGYTENGTNGNGIGQKIRKTIIRRIKQFVSDGIYDTELIDLICVFTEGFGCDRSSDLITFLLKDLIYDYNESIIKELEIENDKLMKYDGRLLIRNPELSTKPLILLPKNILADLPVCYSFSDIDYVISKNQEARENLETYLDFKSVKKVDRYQYLLNNEEFLKLLISCYKSFNSRGYDFDSDPQFLLKFAEFEKIISLNNFKLEVEKQDITHILNGCVAIIKHIIEDCGGGNLLQETSEKGLQLMFFSSSYYLCKQSGVDLVPEANFGRGPVDFFLSNGTDKVSIEFKKSSNASYIKGLTDQLPAYMKSNDSQLGYYFFFDYDEDNKKIDNLYKKHNAMPKDISNRIKIVWIKVAKKQSASKIK